MKMLLIAASALVAVSGAALAERSYDLRDSDTYTGKYANVKPTAAGAEMPWIVITSGNTDLEQRRLDEKNDSSSKR